jgi:hypothetical protein
MPLWLKAKIIWISFIRSYAGYLLYLRKIEYGEEANCKCINDGLSA